MKKKDRIGFLGASALALGAMLSTPVMAQTAPADDEATAETDEEEIVVVGSRLRRNNFNTESPVQVITQEENTLAGLISTTEALQGSTVTGGARQVNGLYGPFVVDGGTGANTMGLRGFGPTSTLILLNGRRLTPAGTRGAVGAADLNTIPSALIERIEILKDGASSIYGSDAVAGVVNIITNQNLEGLVLEGQLNTTEAGGSQQARLSLSGGVQLGPFSLIGSYEYYDRAALTFADREWSRCPLDGVRNPVTGASLEDIDPVTGRLKCFTVTNFAHSAGVTINTIGTSSRPGFGGPGAAATGNFTRWRPNSSVLDGPGGRLDGFEGVNGGGLGFANRDTFDPRMLDQDVFTPVTTQNLFMSATYDLGGRDEFYGEVLFSRRESSATNYSQISLDYANNALLPDELRTGSPFATTTLPVPPPGPLFPTPDYATQVRAFIGFGNITTEQEVDYYRLSGGIRGDIDGIEDWNYDLNISYGRNEGESRGTHFLVDRLFNSMLISPAVGGEPANQVRRINGVDYVCTITLTNPSYGCIPAPQLTTQTLQGNFPGAWLGWVRQEISEVNVFDETSLSLVFDGPLFELPAGPVQSAWGFEFREAAIENIPNINAQQANVRSYSAGGPTIGSDSVAEVFGEVAIPVLHDAPFARSLDVNLSGRWTDYESYGADTTYKAGVTWEPFDGLLLRATRGTSYRAPALFEQFLGPTTGFSAAGNDPCDDYGTGTPGENVYDNCHAEINNTAFNQTNGITVISGGGAATNIFAETSENYTIGLVWRPLRDREGWGEFSFAADNFSIALDNSIQQFGDDNILDACYGAPDMSAEPLCSLVSRDPVTNQLVVTDYFTNVATQEATGWDYAARYVHSLFGGEITANVQITQFNEQIFQLSDDFAPDDSNGRILRPEFVGDGYLQFNKGPLTLHYGVTWIDNMSDYAYFEEDPATSFFDLATDEYFLHHTSVQYDMDALRVTVGVRNLFDRQPDQVSTANSRINGIGATPIYSGFDYLGRQFFVNLSARF